MKKTGRPWRHTGLWAFAYWAFQLFSVWNIRKLPSVDDMPPDATGTTGRWYR